MHTPETVSDRPRRKEIVDRLMQKKSLAVIPRRMKLRAVRQMRKAVSVRLIFLSFLMKTT
jgi:hypothetical protein